MQNQARNPDPELKLVGLLRSLAAARWPGRVTGWPAWRRAMRRAVVGGSVLGLAAGATAVALAATAAAPTGIVMSSSGKPSGSEHPAPGGGHRGKPVPVPPLPLPWWGNVVHATYTIQVGPASFETYDVQHGAASDISQTSISVTSPDGYSSTYVVDPTTIVDAQRDGVLSINTGDEVDITATVTTATSGTTTTATATATQIIDVTEVGYGGCGWPPLAAPGPGGGITGPGGVAGAAAGGGARGAMVGVAGAAAGRGARSTIGGAARSDTGAPAAIICPVPSPVVGGGPVPAPAVHSGSGSAGTVRSGSGAGRPTVTSSSA